MKTNVDGEEEEVCECKQKECEQGKQQVCTEQTSENGETATICKCVTEQVSQKKSKTQEQKVEE